MTHAHTHAPAHAHPLFDRYASRRALPTGAAPMAIDTFRHKRVVAIAAGANFVTAITAPEGCQYVDPFISMADAH